MKKKVLALLLAITMGAVAAIPAGAQGPDVPDEGPVYSHLDNGQVEIISTEGQIQPRYTYLDTITSNLSHKNGYATCTGYVEMQESGQSFTYELVLEYSGNKVNWYEEESWSGSGTGYVIAEEQCDLRSGYYHRVAMKVHVGNEHVTRNSLTVQY